MFEREVLCDEYSEENDDENDMMTAVAIFAIEFSTLGECTTTQRLSS